MVDVADFNLPIFDEPHHPKLGKYTQEHTRKWRASVGAMEAFIFVMPEYSAGPCSAFVNAMTFLHAEWNFNPCESVSDGRISGRLQAGQLSKQLITTLKMAPLIDGGRVPFVTEKLDNEARFTPSPPKEASANRMLSELALWTSSLKVMRANDRKS